ncbi:glucosaminidase domain-containing protein [Flavobacterium sp.]|jgi:flagellum-specific peptidoglycan hydrolase FlgJ|uniref:glucosaminidase domain-containing protein n=1 Tax=Flavobacterium sp. TaxID=239 RepID=UPI0037C06E94
MIKKIVFGLTLIMATACGSNRPVIAYTKSKKKPAKSAAKTVVKPAQPVTETKPLPVNSVETPLDNSTKTANSTEVLAATTRVKVTTAMVLEYIEKYKEIAKKDMIDYGIPASITLGQGILESGAGTGPLSIQANNHFGIKCHKEWNGPSVNYDDDTEQECFRKYTEPNESYRDHSLFLTTRDRYSKLFKLEKDDYKSWAQGLKDAGYATDVAYPTKLIGLIERYQLQKYDAEVLGKEYVPTVVTSNENKPSVAEPSADLHEVIKGDTLYSISKRYNISVEDLKKKNNIPDFGIAIGQKLIVK